MSYIKNCNKCGQRISMREMSHGQWVAFDANTDRPHKHKRLTKKQKLEMQKLRNEASTSDSFSISGLIIGIIVLVILYNVFT